MLNSASRVLRYVLPTNSEVEHARQTFKFSIHGRTFEGTPLVPNRGLLPTVVAILFDQFRSDSCQHKPLEECLQFPEISPITPDRAFGDACKVGLLKLFADFLELDPFAGPTHFEFHQSNLCLAHLPNLYGHLP